MIESKKTLSVVIPCYNSGDYLPDAVGSIRMHPNAADYEVIIVDDGSTEEATKQVLIALQKQGCVVLYQENKGPAAARNTGVRAAVSEYILFLDSDNKIRPTYIDRGIAVLGKHEKVGVVYGNVEFFGTTTQVQFTPRAFNMIEMLSLNYIDMCSVIRKSMWEELGGLDEERKLIGHEDWDFWLRAKVAGWEFVFVDEVLFDYRVRDGSLLKQSSQEEKKQQMLAYFYSKHWELLLNHYKYLSSQFDYYRHDQGNPIRTFFKFMYKRYVSAS